MKKAAIVFGAILIVAGFLFGLHEYYLRSTYGSPASGTGTVRCLDFEGGFWGIVGDDGNNYDITVMGSIFPDEFHVNGLRVGFIGYLNPRQVTYHMWGKVLILDDIWRI